MKNRNAGGPAAAGGMNFQAAVTSFAMIKVLCGSSIGWLDNLVEGVPVAVSSETGGAGDDVCIELQSGQSIEVQAKKGLRAGTKLQDALLELAQGVSAGDVDYGVLAVSSTSSATIKDKLAKNIARRGDGRRDIHCSNAELFFENLKSKGYDVEKVCRNIRIVTLHFEGGDSASLDNSLLSLEGLLTSRKDAAHVWDALYRVASNMVENRGRKDLRNLLRILHSNGATLKAEQSVEPAIILSSFCDWVEQTNSTIPMIGMRRRAQIEQCWVDLNVHIRSPDDYGTRTLSEALEHYHSWGAKQSSRTDDKSDSRWLGRFFKKSILVAGPGMGKSCLATMLAKRYASEKYAVFKVSLKQALQKMNSGATFGEAVIEIGSDGSGLSPQQLATVGLNNAVFLFDGLDECGPMRTQVAEAIVRFSEGLKDARFVVTTRPVGYDPSPFAQWRHYDLIPPETSSAQNNVRRILNSVEPEPKNGADWTSLTEQEIGTDFAKSIAGRSPLMITISAALLYNGHQLGRSNVETYGNFFKLIDDLPTGRVSETSVSSSTLKFVLNCLAWEIAVAPATKTEDRERAMAPKIVSELGCTPLKAKELLSQCIEYWQSKGLVETVHVGLTESMTFVHKTFCEYAAARHLVEMDEAQKAQLVSLQLHQPEFREVVGFAAALGCAPQIIASYDNSSATRSEKLKLLAFLLKSIADGRAPLSENEVTFVVKEAMEAVHSNRGDLGFRVGAGLVRFADVFPNSIVPYLPDLMSSDQIWTRLTGWRLALAVNQDAISMDELKSEMLRLPNNSELATSFSPFGGLRLHDDGQREMFQSFVLYAMELVLSKLPVQEVDEFLPDVLGAEGLSSVGFVEKATEVLKRFGRDYDIEGWRMGSDSLKNWAHLFDPENYHENQKKAFLGMFASFPSMDTTATLDRDETNFLNLSALIEITAFWEETPGQFLSWGRKNPKEPVSEVWRLLLELVDIDKFELSYEVALFRKHIDQPYDKSLLGPFHLFERLDVPEPNFSAVNRCNPDVGLLEQAIHHPIQWVKMTAVQLLNEVLNEQEKLNCAERLLNEGSGMTLWMGVWLAEQADPNRTFSLVIKRLEGRITSDCEYLFRTLVGLPCGDENDALGALQAGLYSDHAQVAEAAGKYAIFLAENSKCEFSTLLSEAFEYWREHEEPYPTEGGTVPPSPREELLNAWSITSEIDEIFLVELFGDPRSDVSKLAQDIGLEMLANDKGAMLLDAAIDRQNYGFVKRLLSAKQNLTEQQVQRIGGYHTTDEPNGRLCSLILMEKGYCSGELADKILSALRDDPLLAIRDRVKEYDERSLLQTS